MTNKRKMKQRTPFDIYTDQHEDLKQLALEERMRGGAGSMSAMVRCSFVRIEAVQPIPCNMSEISYST